MVCVQAMDKVKLKPSVFQKVNNTLTNDIQIIILITILYGNAMETKKSGSIERKE